MGTHSAVVKSNVYEDLHWAAQFVVYFFQAEDGIRASVASRGVGDVYKWQALRVPALRVVPSSPSIPRSATARAF